ncbi:hypothetical protein SPHS6_02414 [Sphingobium sp. S6]|nr:hypothetical protein SPHS6_02414 [Sphingobium sp. S6]
MFDSTNAQPGTGALTIPFVRDAVQRAMIKVAWEIGGPINFDPALRGGALLLQEANLLILGTSAFRPLGEQLFGQIGDLYGMDTLLVRLDACECSFDLRFHGKGEWLSNYRQTLLGGQVWFVPAHEDQSPTVRADSQGLFLNPPMLPDSFYRLGDPKSAERQPTGRDVA